MKFFNSVKSLYTTVALLFLLFLLGVYLDVRNEAMNSRHLQISLALERMIRLEQELTDMLALAVVENNELRATRYETVRQELEAAMQKIVDLTQGQTVNQEVSSLFESHKNISEIEEQSLKEMRAGRWKEAKKILFGEDYLSAKKTYEIDSEMIPGVVLGEINAVENRFNTVKSAALAARIGALGLLIWTGILFSRRTRADLAEQVRLQKEISDANEILEARVRERTEQLGLLLQSAGEGMFGVDDEGRATFINPVAQTLLGFTEEEIIGEEVHALFHHSHEDGSPYPKEECPIFATHTLGTQNQASDEVFWRKDGRPFPVEYTTTPILKEGKVMGAVVTVRDITERKQTEADMQERLKELEQFSLLTVNREEKMIQLKEEINHLLEEMGQEKKYKIVG